jgi:hypothetical protein
VARKSNAYVRSAIHEPLFNKTIGQTLQIRASLRLAALPRRMISGERRQVPSSPLEIAQTPATGNGQIHRVRWTQASLEDQRATDKIKIIYLG